MNPFDSRTRLFASATAALVGGWILGHGVVTTLTSLKTGERENVPTALQEGKSSQQTDALSTSVESQALALEADPALSIILNETNTQRRGEAAWYYFAKLDLASLHKVLKILINEHTTTASKELKRFTLDRLFRRYPKGAITTLKNLGYLAPEKPDEDCLAIWAIYDPREAWNFLKENHQKPPNPVLWAMIDSDPKTAFMLFVQNNQSFASEPIALSAFSAWADSDPPAAMAYAKSVQDSALRLRLVNAVITSSAKADSKGTLVLVNSLPTKKEQFEAISQLASIGASIDPEASADMAHNIGGDLSDIYLQTVMDAWTSTDPAGAENYALNKLSGAVQNQVIQNISNALGHSDPEGTAQWISKMPDGVTKQLASDRLVDTWSQSNPASAAQWIKGVTDPQTQASETARLTAKWASYDPGSAGKWLNSFPDGPGRDAGVAKYVSTLSSIDPVAALNWAGSVADPVLQQQTVDRTYAILNLKNPVALSSWLESSTLSDSVKAHLQKANSQVR